MNSERLFQIILMDLSTDMIKLEQELERVINSDSEITNKVERVKKLLSKIALTEASIAKFNSMFNITKESKQ